MGDEHISIVLIGGNLGDARLVREELSQTDEGAFDLEHADRLATGVERLAKGDVDVVLLDLQLPDSEESHAFTGVQRYALEVPIIVLAGADDTSLGLQAVREGAQDYLVMGQVDGRLLWRAMRHAMARQRMMAELRGLSLVDELTGLNNRRGFVALAQQQWKIAKRSGRGMVLLFADMDGLKEINDTLGHHEGDRALIAVAESFRSMFREADIVARLGGDEFAVLAVDAREEHAELLVARLQASLDLRNAEGSAPYILSMSVGVVAYDPQQPCSLEELVARADAAMYEQKKAKRRYGSRPAAA